MGINAELFTNVADFIGEDDFMGMEGVVDIFDHLGHIDVRFDKRRVNAGIHFFDLFQWLSNGFRQRGYTVD